MGYSQIASKPFLTAKKAVSFTSGMGGIFKNISISIKYFTPSIPCYRAEPLPAPHHFRS